jgi:uncharacterized protein related to proFAR isomerase
VYPRIWVQGFLPTITDERQTYVCRDCGGEGMLLRFDSVDERAKYAAERRGEEDAAPKPRASGEAIPIVPIDAVPLLEVRGVDAIPIYRPKVVDVAWTDGALRRGAYRVDVETYWSVVGGPRYNAESVFVLDLGGVNHANPSFDAVRLIAKHATVLFDLGVRRPEDVMDGFMIDVESVVVGTKGLDAVEQFEEIHDLSEGTIPCIDVAGGVVWSARSREDRNLQVVAARLREIGFTTLAVMDLRRLGTFTGPDPQLVGVLAGLGGDVLLGGGIREEDVAALRQAGIPRALVDPFTPVIRELLPTKEAPTPADALPVDRAARDARGTPAPG